MPLASAAWISTVALQFRGIATPLALLYWTTMYKPKLSQRASTRRAQAIKKIRCMSIPNVEAGFIQLAHQAMMQNGASAYRPCGAPRVRNKDPIEHDIFVRGTTLAFVGGKVAIAAQDLLKA